MFKTLSYFVRQGHRKSNLYVQRYFVTKNKMFQMFQIKVFFYNRLRITIRKVCAVEKNICLGSKNSTLCVQRNVLGENLCIKKLFFCKMLPGNEGKYFGFWGSCFRQGCHHSAPLLLRNVLGKNFSKKSLFSLFPDLEQKIDYWKDIRMNIKTLFYVSAGYFLGKTFFLKLFDISLLVFWAKIL